MESCFDLSPLRLITVFMILLILKFSITILSLKYILKT